MVFQNPMLPDSEAHQRLSNFESGRQGFESISARDFVVTLIGLL